MFLLSLLLTFWLLLFWFAIIVLCYFPFYHSYIFHLTLVRCKILKHKQVKMEWNTFLDYCYYYCYCCCCWHYWWCFRPAWLPPLHLSWRSTDWSPNRTIIIISLPPCHCPHSSAPGISYVLYLLLEMMWRELGKLWLCSVLSCTLQACTWHAGLREDESPLVWRVCWHSLPGWKSQATVIFSWWMSVSLSQSVFCL